MVSFEQEYWNKSLPSPTREYSKEDREYLKFFAKFKAKYKKVGGKRLTFKEALLSSQRESGMIRWHKKRKELKGAYKSMFDTASAQERQFQSQIEGIPSQIMAVKAIPTGLKYIARQMRPGQKGYMPYQQRRVQAKAYGLSMKSRKKESIKYLKDTKGYLQSDLKSVQEYKGNVRAQLRKLGVR